MTGTIRPITETDIPSFHAALSEVIAEERFLALTEVPPLQAVMTRVTAQISANQVHLVALDEQRVIGWCDIVAPSMPGFTHSGYLGMGLIAANRGQGLGSELLRAALNGAWERGLERVELEVFASNKVAQKLFAKAGFEFEGLRRRARYYQGTWTDMVLMGQMKPCSENPEREAASSTIVSRIERESGVPGLTSILANRITGTDLQSLLLEVCRKRCTTRTPAQVLTDFEKNRFVTPAGIAATTQNEWERLILTHLPEAVEPVLLSPLCPLGTNSVVADVDQDWAVATVRNAEVVSDPTNVLALECARRRRQALRRSPKSAAPVHLAAYHRVVRPQWMDLPGFVPHFHLLTMVGAGRDRGGLAFQLETLRMQLSFYFTALSHFLDQTTRYRVSVTNLGPSQREPIIEAGLLAPLRETLVSPVCIFDPARESGRGYYRDLCFKLHVSRDGEEWIEIGDGGHVDWTSRLLSNNKETLVISGLGGERIFWFRDQAPANSAT